MLCFLIAWKMLHIYQILRSHRHSPDNAETNKRRMKKNEKYPSGKFDGYFTTDIIAYEQPLLLYAFFYQHGLQIVYHMNV